jgi:hypothetical protein
VRDQEGERLMSSRLYYPKKQGALLASGAATPADVGDAAKKIGKNIPTELVTAYGALVSAAMTLKWEHFRIWVAFGCLVLCWILTPFYLNMVADKGKPKRNQIIVGTLAFPLWAYLVSGKQIVPDYYDLSLATILAVAFSLIVTFVPMNR